MSRLTFYLILFAIFLLSPLSSMKSFANESLLKYDGEISLLSFPSLTVIQPEGLSVNESGVLFLSDYQSHRIIRLEQNIPVGVSAGRGVEIGRFINPSGLLSLPGGRLYVADSGNHRIQVLDNDLKAVIEAGNYGSEDNSFNRPVSIAKASTDKILVVDTGNSRLMLYGAGGEFLARIGGDGQLEEPVSAAVMNNGDVAVADWGRHGVVFLDRFGREKGFYQKKNNAEYIPAGIFNIPDTSLLIVSDWAGNMIDVINNNGDFLQSIDSAGSVDFKAPSAIAGYGDYVYILDTLNFRIVRLRIRLEEAEDNRKIMGTVDIPIPLITTVQKDRTAENTDVLRGKVLHLLQQEHDNGFEESYLTVMNEEGDALPVEEALHMAELMMDKEDKKDELERVIEPAIEGKGSILMVLDASGSMKSATEVVQKAVFGLLDNLGKNDASALIMFSDTPELLLPFSLEREALKKQMKHYAPKGGTAFYDAVFRANSMMAGRKGRKAIVVLTDGMDEDAPGTGPGSIHNLDQLLSEKFHAPILFVALGDRVDNYAIRKISEYSRGIVVRAETIEDLTDVYRRIGTFLASSVVIRIRSLNH